MEGKGIQFGLRVKFSSEVLEPLSSVSSEEGPMKERKEAVKMEKKAQGMEKVEAIGMAHGVAKSKRSQFGLGEDSWRKVVKGRWRESRESLRCWTWSGETSEVAPARGGRLGFGGSGRGMKVMRGEREEEESLEMFVGVVR